MSDDRVSADDAARFLGYKDAAAWAREPHWYDANRHLRGVVLAPGAWAAGGGRATNEASYWFWSHDHEPWPPWST